MPPIQCGSSIMIVYNLSSLRLKIHRLAYLSTYGYLSQFSKKCFRSTNLYVMLLLYSFWLITSVPYIQMHSRQILSWKPTLCTLIILLLWVHIACKMGFQKGYSPYRNSVNIRLSYLSTYGYLSQFSKKCFRSTNLYVMLLLYSFWLITSVPYIQMHSRQILSWKPTLCTLIILLLWVHIACKMGFQKGYSPYRNSVNIVFLF